MNHKKEPFNKRLKTLTLELDTFEVLAVELLTKLMVWTTPIMAGVLIWLSLVALDYGPGVAALMAFVIEGLGLAFMNTTVSLYYRWQNVSDMVNFLISGACSLAYFATVLVIVLVVKLLPAWAVIVPALAVILSGLSAVVGGIRSNNQKSDMTMTRPMTRKKSRSRPNESGGVPPLAQTDEERAAYRARANEARGPRPAQIIMVKQLRDDGNTWGQVADEMNRSMSTVKRWYDMADHLQPISLNGKGGHHE